METKRSRAEVLKLLQSLDRDNSGKVSAGELMAVLGDEVTHEELKAFIARHDKDNDGELDINELVDFFTK
ncbi:unnamed protein product [Hydatigera taeniaeformis]|uniref:Calmodulin n=1 Tax=Hydatigena taeniaeformis TaxID=6205 RepID=A0A0R3WTW8_HYDTA|nr:unnamed protein product [Hydatigera taeniaeformis]